MSKYFPEPKSSGRTGVDTLKFAKKLDLGNLM